MGDMDIKVKGQRLKVKGCPMLGSQEAWKLGSQFSLLGLLSLLRKKAKGQRLKVIPSWEVWKP